jgi:pyridoxal phosphate enzyme (YggS family)
LIKENLELVEEKIQKACDNCKRSRSEVTLIAVSKTKPISMIEEAMEMGVRVFGENKVQELTDKYETLPKDIQWHFIGHLQRNKVKYMIDKVSCIHSVDSFRLAETIDKEAQKKNVTVDILIEVNAAKEESKFGVYPEDTLALVESISKLSNISIKGLMTIAPFVANPEDNRIHFKNLRQLYIDIKNKNLDNVNMCILSMGMSNDYQVAIEEGATMVRVGTSIFGDRNYNAIN